MRKLSQSLIVVVLLGFTLLALAGPPSYLPVEKVRADFKRLLERKKAPLEVKSATSQDGEFRIERGSIGAEAVERIPFVLVRSASAARRLPAVIALHGTGGNKEGQVPLLRTLAARSFVAIAIDGRYHGERVTGGAQGATEYQDAIIRAWKEKDAGRQEHPFFYDTAWDLWRTVDYLQTRSDVDGARIGVIGFSKGGIEIWLGASVDDRIKVAVPAIGVQSFRWSLDHDQWQGRAKTIARAHEVARQDLGEPVLNQRVCRELWNKLIPGILDEFDCPSMIRLFAPRPLLILSGENDPNCPLPGAKLAFAAAEQAYVQARAGDRLKIMVAPGVGHAVTPEQREAALEWLQKWLTE